MLPSRLEELWDPHEQFIDNSRSEPGAWLVTRPGGLTIADQYRLIDLRAWHFGKISLILAVTLMQWH